MLVHNELAANSEGRAHYHPSTGKNKPRWQSQLQTQDSGCCCPGIGDGGCCTRDQKRIRHLRRPREFYLVCKGAAVGRLPVHGCKVISQRVFIGCELLWQSYRTTFHIEEGRFVK